MSQHVTSFNLHEASEKATYLQRASFNFTSYFVWLRVSPRLCVHTTHPWPTSSTSFLISGATPLPTYFVQSHYLLHNSGRLLLVSFRPGTIGPRYFFYFDRWHFVTFVSNSFVLFPFTYLFLWHISVRLLLSWHILHSLIFLIAYLSVIPFRLFTLFVYTFPRTFAIRRYTYTHCSITLCRALFHIWLICL